MNSHGSGSGLDNALSNTNSRCGQDSSDLDLAHLTGTLETCGDSNSNHMSGTSGDELKPSTPNFHSADLNSFNSAASTPLPDSNNSGSNNNGNSNNGMNDNSAEALNNLVSGSGQDENRFLEQNSKVNESPMNES